LRVKKFRFEPNVPGEFRAIDKQTAMQILAALHRYAETGEGNVKRLSSEFQGLLRLRIGNHRVLFDETADVITLHRVRDRKDAYR
jgi:mRNA-degrading endonuclease RelE of RelBE toxin-antitoxin system